MSNKKNNESILDKLIANLICYKVDIHLLDAEQLKTDRMIKAIPLRYQIIANAFVDQLTLEDLNTRLVTNGCEQLYSRSPYDASLIFAFTNHLSYQEWKTLMKECSSALQNISSDPYLGKSKIALSDIRSYVNANSSTDDDESYLTMHRTAELNRSLSRVSKEKKDFLRFLSRNMSQFSFVRESTRYYFCKYLMYFLDTRKNNYAKALTNNQDVASAFRKLSVFRVQTSLDRKRYEPEEALVLIDEASVSLGEIYDSFQQFYFDYTSIDWLQVLVDRYDLHNLTSRQIKELAYYLRKYDNKSENYSDTQIVEWFISEQEKKERDADEKHSLNASSKSYGEGRSGENFIRKVLRGSIDLDRTTFLAFLLFFDKESDVPLEHRITELRLREILANCGFPQLNRDNPFDDFFLDYLNTDDPMLFLLQEAEIMAMSEENFYLYKTYLNSKSMSSEFEKMASLE